MAAYFEQGKYRIRITAQAITENKNGNPEVQLTFDIIGQYRDNKPVMISAEYPRTIYLVLTDKTVGTPTEPGWVLEVLQSLGFNGESFAQLDPSHPKAISFIGQEVDARCNHEEWQGKEREKWSIVRPGGGSNGLAPAKPIEKKGLRALDAKFGKVLKAAAGKPRQSGGGTAVADDPLDPPPPGRDEESIPF